MKVDCASGEYFPDLHMKDFGLGSVNIDLGVFFCVFFPNLGVSMMQQGRCRPTERPTAVGIAAGCTSGEELQPFLKDLALGCKGLISRGLPPRFQ